MASDRDVVVRVRVDARGVREALLGLSARRPPKWRRVLARWFRALRRYPRLVSYATYCKATVEAPGSMRRGARLRKQHARLLAAHRAERKFHRAALAEKEDLKLLLALVDRPLHDYWLAQRRAGVPVPRKAP
jgi:hypothetical protein